METLKDQERKTLSFLSVQYRRISTAYEQIRASRAQREAFAEQLGARQQEFLAGRGTLDVLLEAQRFCADAQANESQSLIAYNNALAGYDFARGRSLRRAHLVRSKKPLLSPDKERKCAAKSAALKALPLEALWLGVPADLVARLAE
jgi:outer membrane protein TolC